MKKPVCIDLFCGLGGWTDGFLAEGWDCVGFDIERHDYGTGGYPAQLVLQDVLTLDGRQFKGKASIIVASPPCQEYSYMAMQWSRAKAIAAEYRSGIRDVAKLTALFDACFRIAREAELPLIVENVRGAVPWVGPARWNYGSFYLWGDVPALMPMTFKGSKVPMPGGDSLKAGFQQTAALQHRKNSGGSWFNIANNTESGCGKNPVHGLAGEKHRDTNGYERNHPEAFGWKSPRTSPKSNSRKAASAQIAKIPLPLSRWIAQCFKPCLTTAIKRKG